MPWPLPDVVETLLWCAAGLMVAYIFVPMLFMALGQTRVTFAVLGGPESAQPSDDDLQNANLYERLRDLGFEPLGSRREIGWFANGHWYKRYLPGRIWTTPARDCFVTLFRLFPEEPWRLTFSTIFTDGSAVQTAKQLTRLRIEAQDYLRWACPLPDLADVLKQHRLVSERFGADRGAPVAAPDLPGALECLCRHSQNHLRKIGPKQALTIGKLPLLIFFVAICASDLWFDSGSWATAADVILGGVLYKLLMPFWRRKAAEKLRDEDQEQVLANQWAIRRQAAGRGVPDAPRFSSAAITAPPRPSEKDDRLTHNS
jgi:hypothetical protein